MGMEVVVAIFTDDSRGCHQHNRTSDESKVGQLSYSVADYAGQQLDVLLSW